MKFNLFFAGLATIAEVVRTSTFSPARPPAIPLAVKSPYMSTWLEAGSNGNGLLAGSWSRFWAGLQPGSVAGSTGAVTGWAGLIKVDGITYTWMGDPVVNEFAPPAVTQESFEYTSQRSTFIMDVAGKVSMNVTFLSPLTPKDIRRQSIIGSYLSVTVAAIDGITHSVQLYSDISGEWVSPTHNQDAVQWSYNVENGIASHQSYRQTQSEFNADFADDGAHWGNWYYSTAATPSLSYQSGPDFTVRGNFINSGVLPNTQDNNYRAINNNWPVFGFANALGNVGAQPVNNLYTIVHAQQNAILFDGADGLKPVPSLWTAYFGTDLAMVDFFYKDFPSNQGAIDHLIAVDSIAAGTQDYLTITSLSARQAFAAVQLCGTTAKPYLFLKEISSDGNLQTVDVLFPMFPILFYTNPLLLKYSLDPLFENQEAGRFPQTYAIHDLGSNYPQALGHPSGDGEPMPLEECGNMLIMTLAYAQRTNDNAYLTAHYAILKQWTSYLVQEALIPANQLSTDDFQGQLSNQTNLALKGIIGIEAMSVIAKRTGNAGDARKYSGIAHDYIKKWQDLAIVKGAVPHTNLHYGDDGSHGLLYNLYGDRILGLGLVPQAVYDMQSAFYPTVAKQYGVALDTRNMQTKSDWEIWCASIASTSTKQMFISKLANWIGITNTNRAFTDLYDSQTGEFATGPFIARPVVGGHFALLALNGAPTGGVGRNGVRSRMFDRGN